ncbi:MAG TPA: OsmC family protein, partial [Gemmatimonadaceae bacterium]|nr:OsmC family protein [Gemmatimonadaceae bacterium]
MTARAPTPVAAKPSRIHVEWAGAHRFDAGRPGGPTARIDGEGETGQSPPETLLTALATCVSYDVIDILAKKRTPIESLEIDVLGERVDTIPRRYKHITLNFRIGGKGIEKEQALRAIELSATKYCSVRDSLR